MIDRFEILASKIRYLVSRNRWSARLLGFRPVDGLGDEPGLILLQIDGLGEQVLRRALDEGKMPFLRHLLEDEGYGRRRLYSGMASNTPNFQGELFYGVKTAVPGFGFLDPVTGREMVMNSFSDSAEIEKRLADRGEGLLAGGAAWSDLLAGGAAESHLCASTAGLGEALRALNPFRMLAVIVWHGWAVVRVLSNFVAELALAVLDFVNGTIAGRHFAAELRFIPERVAVTALMREVVTAGVCIDAERGLPVIHANFLGYDEHAHRRGPDSRFASWTLQGIDRSLRRIWLSGHRSPRRDYQLWVYSDHGQEPVEPYRRRHGEDVRAAIERIWRRFRESGIDAPPAVRPERAVRAAPPEKRVARSGRSRWLRRDLPEWMARDTDDERDRASRPPAGELHVVHRGPVGFVYLPDGTTREQTAALGRAAAVEAGVPMVLMRGDDGKGATVWTPEDGPVRLPERADDVFGDHPHRAAVCEDVLRIVRHEAAGDLVLMGWNPRRAVSFKYENGAHGSAGPRETSAFLVVSPETASRVPVDAVLRPLDLRELARDVLDPERAHISVRAVRRRERGPRREVPSASVRLMTYNVHGCRGMDGRFSTQRIARVVARERPDIVCLQELDQSRTRSGGVDQVREIAAQLEKDFQFHAVTELDDGHFGNAVLSSLPIRLRGTGPLPRVESRLPLTGRGVLWVEVDVDGTPVQVLNTHLSIHQRERRIQAAELAGERWLRSPECAAPLVLAGDFNASAVSHTAKRIETVLRNAVRDGAAGGRYSTWSSRYPVRRIDHVFTSADLEILSVQVPRSRLARVASDHLPLVVELAAPRPAPEAASA